MQIVLWGVFHNGEAQGIEEGEDAAFLPDAVAVCLNKACGREFKWRQFTYWTYSIVAYHRTTERVAGIVDVPTTFIPQVLAAAAIEPAAAHEPGEIELSEPQALALAGLLGFLYQPARFYYYLDAKPPNA